MSERLKKAMDAFINLQPVLARPVVRIILTELVEAILAERAK